MWPVGGRFVNFIVRLRFEKKHVVTESECEIEKHVVIVVKE